MLFLIKMPIVKLFEFSVSPLTMNILLQVI